jgi:hypothetical protein
MCKTDRNDIPADFAVKEVLQPLRCHCAIVETAECANLHAQHLANVSGADDVADLQRKGCHASLQSHHSPPAARFGHLRQLSYHVNILSERPLHESAFPSANRIAYRSSMRINACAADHEIDFAVSSERSGITIRLRRSRELVCFDRRLGRFLGRIEQSHDLIPFAALGGQQVGHVRSACPAGGS